MREEQAEPSPDSNAEEPVTVRIASEPPAATLAKKSSEVEANAPASTEARESDPDGMLEIESLSQGTLEPVMVNGTAEISSAKGSDLQSVASTEAQAKSGSGSNTVGAGAQKADGASQGEAQEALGVGASKHPRGPETQQSSSRVSPKVPAKQTSAAPTSRRNVVLLGLGGLCALSIWVFAMRPHSPGPNSASVSIDSSPKSSSASAQAQALERQVALSRDEASSTSQGMDSNRNSQQVAPTSPGATPSFAAASEPVGEDTVRVAINIRPEGARVFYRGKEVGRTPFTLELLRGERRVFEVGYPGYSTRRLIIDGTEKEVSFNMTPDTK